MKPFITILFIIAAFTNLNAQIIITFAGNGTGGNSGDGGQATSASIATPRGLAIDAAGNVYISSPSGFVVRKISTNGIISTVAGNGTWGNSGDGGQATSAQIRSLPWHSC